MLKEHLALNNIHWLIFYKAKLNQMLQVINVFSFREPLFYLTKKIMSLKFVK